MHVKACNNVTTNILACLPLSRRLDDDDDGDDDDDDDDAIRKGKIENRQDKTGKVQTRRAAISGTIIN